jgi:hypothetical protein
VGLYMAAAVAFAVLMLLFIAVPSVVKFWRT